MLSIAPGVGAGLLAATAIHLGSPTARSPHAHRTRVTQAMRSHGILSTPAVGAAVVVVEVTLASLLAVSALVLLLSDSSEASVRLGRVATVGGTLFFLAIGMYFLMVKRRLRSELVDCGCTPRPSARAPELVAARATLTAVGLSVTGLALLRPHGISWLGLFAAILCSIMWLLTLRSMDEISDPKGALFNV